DESKIQRTTSNDYCLHSCLTASMNYVDKPLSSAGNLVATNPKANISPTPISTLPLLSYASSASTVHKRTHPNSVYSYLKHRQRHFQLLEEEVGANGFPLLEFKSQSLAV
ncbi:hypothetical protein SK128_009454, partial [Halocaridina rubra]